MMILEIKSLSLSVVITLDIAGISWEFSLLLCAELRDLHRLLIIVIDNL